MRNFLIIFISILFSEFSAAQCSVSFDDLDKSTNFTFSSFDTFALRHGYSYDSEKDAFICDFEYKDGAHLQLLRSKTQTGYNSIQSVFFSKNTYLDYKQILESKGQLYKNDTENNTLTFIYIYDNSVIILQTKTVNSTTVYFITLSNEKLY